MIFLKGFTKDKKFHPIKESKGVRKKRDKSIQPEGVLVSNIRKKRDSNDLVPIGKSKTILIGKSKDGEGITLTLDLEREGFSIHGDTWDMNEVLTEQEGEERAREDLEEGEVWRLQVEAGNETRGLDDFVEEVINIDGWQHVLGDIDQIGEDQFVRQQGGGQIDVSRTLQDWEQLEISNDDLKTILNAWKKLHLKDIKKMTSEERELMDKARKIFGKETGFEKEQLARFIRE